MVLLRWGLLMGGKARNGQEDEGMLARLEKKEKERLGKRLSESRDGGRLKVGELLGEQLVDDDDDV